MKVSIKITLTAVMVLIVTNSLFAQDQHFSRFTNTPLFINPANTGFFIGSWRVGAAYRTQWRSVDVPFETYMVSAEKKFELKGDRAGLGLVILNDRSGPASLNISKMYFSGAYTKYHNGHGVSLGFQPGVIYHTVSSDVTFPDQYNPETGEFESSMVTLEDLGELQKINFDINAGLLWNFRAEKWSVYAGMSLSHLTQPNESFIDAIDAVLPRKILFHSAFAISITERIAFSPSILYARHNQATEFLLGAWFDFAVGYDYHRMGVKFGTNYRNNTRGYSSGSFTDRADAINVMVGFRWQDLDLGVSYDINVSSLTAASRSRGGLELTLLYFHGSADDDFGKDIPCWRY